MAGKKLFGRMWITRTIHTQRVSIFLYASVHTLRFQSAFFCGDLGWFHCSVEQQEFLSLRSSSSPSTAIDSKHTHTKRDSSTSLVSFTFVEKGMMSDPPWRQLVPSTRRSSPPLSFSSSPSKMEITFKKKKRGPTRRWDRFMMNFTHTKHIDMQRDHHHWALLHYLLKLRLTPNALKSKNKSLLIDLCTFVS